jgi:hypothetical protein
MTLAINKTADSGEGREAEDLDLDLHNLRFPLTVANTFPAEH